MRGRGALLALAALVCVAASAADPSQALKDPAQEHRARLLFRQVRCLVCQNESIDDSEAPLAADLRGVVRSQVAAGRSDAQIKTWLVDRYGEFVLLRPAFNPANALLWLAPFAVVGLGGAGLWAARRRPGPPAEPGLSDEEQARLDAVVRGPGETGEPTRA